MPLLHSTAAKCYPNRTIIRNYPQRGRQAVLADPDGAVFAVLAVEDGDPPDYLATPGEWIWSSLHVRDPKQETAFYKILFGYDVYELPSEGDAQHYILSICSRIRPARMHRRSMPCRGRNIRFWALPCT
jgi:hypothetical protein